ncbi:uncharacterized protein LOC144112848 isoform X1 [Amblyomma americanum]
MDCSQSPSETSASVRRAGEPAAVSGEPVSKGYVQSRSSQSLLLFQKDADGTSPTGSTLNQACSHASGFIMVQSDHTYAGPSTEASASSLEPGTAGVAATLSASADLSPGAPFSSSPLSCEGSFTSPINERRPLQKLRAKLRQLRNRNKRLQGLLLQRRRMKTTAELQLRMQPAIPRRIRHSSKTFPEPWRHASVVLPRSSAASSRCGGLTERTKSAKASVRRRWCQRGS